MPTRIPIEDSFDLHSFLSRDLPEILAEYLAQAHRKNLTEVRVIHGKGTGARRAQVRKLLSENPLVVDYSDAPPARGGVGATIVWLKP